MTRYNILKKMRQHKIPLFIIFLLSFCSFSVEASFSNYNSILIGDRAAGMGGAYTALTGDPAGSSYYNPAALSRSYGSALSAAINVYSKYDTRFGNTDENFAEAPLRINRGKITPIPASSGSFYNYGNFAVGISILFPDFDQYAGNIIGSNGDNSFLNLRDESLWVGGTLAVNSSPTSSVGLSMYYTSRSYTRSLSDKSEESSITTIITEDKTFTHNSIVYILGYYAQLNRNWSLGFAHRFPSLPISGEGSYIRNQLQTSGTPDSIKKENLLSQTQIPPKTTFGIAYEEIKNVAYSFDISFYGAESYADLSDPVAADHIRHKDTWNFNFGYETYIKPWVALRAGVYTNYSSHPDISPTTTVRVGDHINMWGFSTNFALFTSEKTTITLGGFYTGGKGYSVQQVGKTLSRVKKSVQVFSFLVGTSFYF